MGHICSELYVQGSREYVRMSCRSCVHELVQADVTLRALFDANGDCVCSSNIRGLKKTVITSLKGSPRASWELSTDWCVIATFGCVEIRV